MSKIVKLTFKELDKLFKENDKNFEPDYPPSMRLINLPKKAGKYFGIKVKENLIEYDPFNGHDIDKFSSQINILSDLFGVGSDELDEIKNFFNVVVKMMEYNRNRYNIKI